MDIRERLLAQTAHVEGEGEGEITVVDVGAFVRRLILFEHYVMDSIRLTEFPVLVGAFGRDGMIKLLESGALSIRAEALSFGQTGQLAVLESREKKGLLPLGSYSFQVVQVADRQQYLSECLQGITAELGEGKQTQKLKRAIVDRIVPLPDNLITLARHQLAAELGTNGPHLARSVAMALTEKIGTAVSPSAFTLRIHEIDEGDYRVESDIEDQFGLGEEDAHRVMERGLLGIAGLSMRLAQMEAYEVVTGFREGELPIFETKLSFLAKQLDPEAQEARLDRLVELAGLPDIKAAVEKLIDVEALLELRQEPEWQSFREWLRQADSAPDEEIQAQLRSASQKLARIIHGTPGKVARFALVTGAGFAGLGKPAEISLGVIDEFLIEKVVPRPGPVSFLSRLYKSIFSG
jgi:hypothetical protein